MEIVLTFLLLNLLVISLCRLIGCKAKTTVIWVVLVNIAYIAIIIFFVDLSTFWAHIKDLFLRIFGALKGAVT